MNPIEVNADFKVFVDGRDFNEVVKEKFHKAIFKQAGDKESLMLCARVQSSLTEQNKVTVQLVTS